MSQHNDVYKITIDWSKIAINITADHVQVFSVPAHQLCQEEVVGLKKLFDVPMPYKEAMTTCKNFKGEMILPTSAVELSGTFHLNRSLLEKHCRSSFWLPIVRSKDNFTKWENGNNIAEGVPYITWQYGQPNGYPTQNCVGE